MALFNELKEMY